MRTELFPQIPLRPKHHYLTHYPYLIRKFGPLKHLWTLREESKHRYFKNILKHCCNYKNILFTLNEKHQLLQALHHTQGFLFSDNVVSEASIEYIHTDYDAEIVNFVTEHCHFKGTKFVSTKVQYRSIIYAKGMHVCCSKLQDDGGFLLCAVQYIFVNETYNEIFFVGEQKIVYHNKNKGIFEIDYDSNDNDMSLIGRHYKDLLTHEPLLHFITQSGRSLFFFHSAPLGIL